MMKQPNMHFLEAQMYLFWGILFSKALLNIFSQASIRFSSFLPMTEPMTSNFTIS